MIPQKWTTENQQAILKNALIRDIVPSIIHNGGDNWMAQIIETGESQSMAPVGIRNQYIPIAWAPQAAALSIANSLGFSMKNCYIFMRLASLFFYVTLLSICIAIIPQGKIAATILSLNPYSIFMASSISSDTYTIALTSLFLALIFRLCLEREQSVDYWKKTMLITLSVLLFLGKTSYAAVILLIFVLPEKQFSIKQKLTYFFSSSLIGGGVYIVWYMFFLHTIPAPWVDQSMNVQLILKSPFRAMASVIINTIFPKDDAAWFIKSITSNLNESRWMLLPVTMVALAGISFTIYAKIKSRGRFNIPLLLGVFFAAFSAIALTRAFLLLTWTDIRAGFITISGFQGRYYLPLIFVLLAPFVAYESRVLNPRAHMKDAT